MPSAPQCFSLREGTRDWLQKMVRGCIFFCLELVCYDAHASVRLSRFNFFGSCFNFCFQFWHVRTYYYRRPSSNWNLNFVWPVLAWLLACVFLMNLSAFLVLRAFVQSICRNAFQECTFHLDATTWPCMRFEWLSKISRVLLWFHWREGKGNCAVPRPVFFPGA